MSPLHALSDLNWPAVDAYDGKRSLVYICQVKDLQRSIRLSVRSYKLLCMINLGYLMTSSLIDVSCLEDFQAGPLLAMQDTVCSGPHAHCTDHKQRKCFQPFCWIGRPGIAHYSWIPTVLYRIRMRGEIQRPVGSGHGCWLYCWHPPKIT